MKAWKVYVFWVVLAEGVGALSGFLTRDGIKAYTQSVSQPPLAPPPWVFPIVWGILFALMGIGAARVYLSAPGPDRRRGLVLFGAQLLVNFLWSLIFFNLQAFALAFVWLLLLWVLVLLMLLTFRRVDPVAGWLQLPYLLWVSFAGYLTLGVWLLNR